VLSTQTNDGWCCVLLQEVAAEHDRIKNKDKKAMKEEQYKKREVGSWL
jgi:hypothetical protein